MSLFKEKWALVTGASRGIGSQIAIGLAKRGCNVVVHARKLASTESTVDKVRRMNVKVLAVEAELDDYAQVDGMIEKIKSEIGGVDILYNNAAVMNEWKETFDIQTEEWEKLFRVNLFSIVRLCSAFIPIMKERGWGRVINVSSGIQDIPQLSPYACSKWALDKYTSDMAAELKDTDVMVNGMDPGWIRTDLGGEHADHAVETVLPGMILPVLLTKGDSTGRKYSAQDFKHLK